MRKEGAEVSVFLYFVWLPKTVVHLSLKVVSKATDHNVLYQPEWKSHSEL